MTRYSGREIWTGGKTSLGALHRQTRPGIAHTARSREEGEGDRASPGSESMRKSRRAAREVRVLTAGPCADSWLEAARPSVNEPRSALRSPKAWVTDWQ